MCYPAHYQSAPRTEWPSCSPTWKTATSWCRGSLTSCSRPPLRSTSSERSQAASPAQTMRWVLSFFFPSSVSVFYQSLQALCSIWYTSCWGFSLKTFPGDFKDITRSIATLTIMIHLLKVVFATATDFSLVTSICVCLCVYRCTPSTAVFSPAVHNAAVWAQRARASASSTSTTTVFPRQHRPSWPCTVVARLRSSIPNW